MLVVEAALLIVLMLLALVVLADRPDSSLNLNLAERHKFWMPVWV